MNFKKISIYIVTLIIFSGLTSINAQVKPDDIAGTWMGKMKAGGTALRIVFNIEKNDSGELTATMDSPDQGAEGIEVSGVTLDNDSVFIEVKSIKGEYKGLYHGDSITGKWSQSGRDFSLTLEKQEGKLDSRKPQDPEKPYPYTEEKVTFENKEEGITLAGTLTYPERSGNFPAVVLVSGSGPQDRNETIFGHKPFLIIADYLTRNGIAVLRYDDRGVGESEGKFGEATSEDFRDDAISAVEYLKSRDIIDDRWIGIIGHSEGGLIAPMASIKSDNISFIVLLAGPSVPGDTIIMSQTKAQGEAAGIDEKKVRRSIEFQKDLFKIIKETDDRDKLKELISKRYDEYVASASEEEKEQLESQGEQGRKSIIKQFSGPWIEFFINFDPKIALRKVEVPVLALFGEEDLQVLPELNVPPMRKALEDAPTDDYTIEVLDDLNHLFQTSESGIPTNYASIDETFAPKALEVITEWILKTTKRK